jgi:hypothetical protein
MPDQPKKPQISPERSREIVTRIIEHLPDKRMPNCPICGQNKWQFVPGFISLSLTANLGQVALGGPNLPCVAIVCGVCGNTVLMNTIVLGLEQIATPEPAEVKVEVTAPEVKQGTPPKE